MNAPKYIVHRNAAFIFPAFVDHADFARKNHLNIDEIQGAGFVCQDDKGFLSCYGKSQSLKISSREEDSICVQNLFSPYF